MNGRSTAEPVAWGGNCIRYIDQRLLPHDVRVAEAKNVEDIHDAIASLAVRGAPCIGVFAAYGIALLRNGLQGDDFARAAARVRDSRPTAVNLAWAVDRVMKSEDALAEARLIHEEQRAMDTSIAESALELFPRTATVLTHCNTGPLATGAHGTALGAIIHAAHAGHKVHVFVDETRPLLQGARLTVYE
ncbi:MAG: S-methyl-5-thioribose-1-phosphate isomerase, partial [Candidatus Eremiobacteraeota bacterium]|nr:S-methyl-5-thioribose-1-phosphate isomerase [Candidatus Eremiobacteraeota bacterium]